MAVADKRCMNTYAWLVLFSVTAFTSAGCDFNEATAQPQSTAAGTVSTKLVIDDWSVVVALTETGNFNTLPTEIPLTWFSTNARRAMTISKRPDATTPYFYDLLEHSAGPNMEVHVTRSGGPTTVYRMEGTAVVFIKANPNVENIGLMYSNLYVTDEATGETGHLFFGHSSWCGFSELPCGAQ